MLNKKKKKREQFEIFLILKIQTLNSYVCSLFSLILENREKITMLPWPNCVVVGWALPISCVYKICINVSFKFHLWLCQRSTLLKMLKEKLSIFKVNLNEWSEKSTTNKFLNLIKNNPKPYTVNGWEKPFNQPIIKSFPNFTLLI